METNSKFATASFYDIRDAIEGNKDSIISYETDVQLSFVPVFLAVLEYNYQTLCSKYSGIFHGLEKLKDKHIQLHVKENVECSTDSSESKAYSFLHARSG